MVCKVCLLVNYKYKVKDSKDQNIGLTECVGVTISAHVRNGAALIFTENNGSKR